MKVNIIPRIVNKLRRCIAIVEDGDTCSISGGISNGKWIVWKGGLYQTSEAISYGSSFTVGTNLTAKDGGIGNQLQTQISELNSNISHIGHMTNWTGTESLEANTIKTIKTITISDLLYGSGVYMLYAHYDFNAIDVLGEVLIRRDGAEYAGNFTKAMNGIMSVCCPIRVETSTIITIEVKCASAQTNRGWRISIVKVNG